MEEKERYELNDNDCIIDNEKDVAICDVCDVSESPKTLVDLLNQQSKRLKELEQENQQLKDQVKKSYQEGLLQKQFDKDMEIQELKDKIETLKQSQKQLATGELRRIKEYILINDKYDEEVGCNIIETFDLIEDIIDRIEKLGGGENE